MLNTTITDPVSCIAFPPGRSSFIYSCEWSSEVMNIVFTNQKVYSYYNVPEKVFGAFVNAPSLGKYMNEHLKGKYPNPEDKV